jgi:hypothetical protein
MENAVMPLRSADHTHGLFFWGFIKGSVYVLPLLMAIDELRSWITEACAKLTLIFSENVAGS